MAGENGQNGRHARHNVEEARATEVATVTLLWPAVVVFSTTRKKSRKIATPSLVLKLVCCVHIVLITTRYR